MLNPLHTSQGQLPPGKVLSKSKRDTFCALTVNKLTKITDSKNNRFINLKIKKLNNKKIIIYV
jgi:hypothetical protein